MFSLNFFKFFAGFAFLLLFFPACRFWQKAETPNPTPTPFAAEELKSGVPFATKEPEIYQAEFVVTASERENKMFAARNGANRRFDYNSDAKNQVSLLQTDKNYLLFPDKKIYAENASGNFGTAGNWTDFLTTEWLNSKADAKFFKLEAENNLSKYRVVFGDEGKSESIIYIDERENLPVKQEFYSVNGDQKTLMMTVELKNLKLETPNELFAVPKDFRKVPVEEFRKISQSENNE